MPDSTVSLVAASTVNASGLIRGLVFSSSSGSQCMCEHRPSSTTRSNSTSGGRPISHRLPRDVQIVRQPPMNIQLWHITTVPNGNKKRASVLPVRHAVLHALQSLPHDAILNCTYCAVGHLWPILRIMKRVLQGFRVEKLRPTFAHQFDDAGLRSRVRSICARVYW